MSPFTYAHKINEPILLIHGEADNNSGTFPIQSERLFQAVNGNGGTARLVMLPHESHGYALVKLSYTYWRRCLIGPINMSRIDRFHVVLPRRRPHEEERND